MRTRRCTSASRGRRNGWSRTWRWRGSCSSGCCRRRCRTFQNAEVASRFAPARQIGGDLYDFLKYSGQGVTGIAVGDVSGKGAPAAIYAALVSGIARSLANEEPSAAGMLEAINLSLSERPDRRTVRLDDLRHLGRPPATAPDRQLRPAASACIVAMASWRRFKPPVYPSVCFPMPPMTN